jgi:hypothetical protein
MPRRALAAVALLLAATTAAADPPRFKPFNGVSPEQFYQSSVARWADQLALDVGEVRAAANRAPTVPRQQVEAAANNTIRAAHDLAALARRTADRGQLYRAETNVDAMVAALDRTIGQFPAGAPVFAESLARVAYDRQQLAVAILGTDRSPDHTRRVAAQLAEGLDHQAQELRALTESQLGPAFERDTGRSAARFARAASRLHRNLDAGAAPAAALNEYAAVTRVWGEVSTQLGNVPRLSPAVRAQAARVDGLYRKLGEVLTGSAAPLATTVAVQPPMGAVAPPAPQPPMGATPPAPLGPNGKWIWEPGTGWLWDPAGGTAAGATLRAPSIGLNPPKVGVTAVGAGAGGGPRVRVFHDAQANAAFDFFAYDPGFRGGVRVAVGDLNGDGVPDLVTAPGPGSAALVRVFDGRDGSLMVEFNSFGPEWTGGVTVAAADLQRDGRALVAVGADAGGGPHVKVFDLAQGREVASFFAYDQGFRGGVRIAYGDVDGDGVLDLITVPGPGAPAIVKVFNGKDNRLIAEYPAIDPRWAGGAWVAAGNVKGDPRAEVIVGPDAGGPPVVRVLDGLRGQLVRQFEAFPGGFRGGVRVAAHDFDHDGTMEVVCGAGNGLPGSPFRVFSGRNQRPVADVPAFPDFAGGCFVACR